MEKQDIQALAKALAPEIARELARELRVAGVSLIDTQTAALLGPDEQTTFNVGPLVVDLRRHEVTKNGTVIPLKPREFTLLATLARNPGQAFTRTQLIDLAYPVDVADSIESDRTIDVHVRRLRLRLGDEKAEMIRTIHGIGYKIESEA
jgi:DNA-binding response OmpR family regulator